MTFLNEGGVAVGRPPTRRHHRAASILRELLPGLLETLLLLQVSGPADNPQVRMFWQDGRLHLGERGSLFRVTRKKPSELVLRSIEDIIANNTGSIKSSSSVGFV